MLRDVARALAYAHERGIVHRDIKPDNVLLSGGAAVVTDFGIAKAISASRTASGDGATLTQLGTSIGTPAYMSPEQAAGDPDIDHRADIYSFGCMAYELLTGQPPFANRTPQRLMAAHMSEKPQPIAELRPDVPPTLAALVMRCLEKDAAARPQSASDLLAALDTPTSDAGQVGDAGDPPRRARHVAQGARRVRGGVRRRGGRGQGGDRRHRAAGLGLSRRAHRDGARPAGHSVHGVRAVRRASRGDGDADVHAGRHAVARARHDGDDRDEGEPARVVAAHGDGRRVRGRRVRRAGRRVHGAARARHRPGRIAPRRRAALGARSRARDGLHA